jgi:hypothetical protein
VSWQRPFDWLIPLPSNPTAFEYDLENFKLNHYSRQRLNRVCAPEVNKKPVVGLNRVIQLIHLFMYVVFYITPKITVLFNVLHCEDMELKYNASRIL